MDGRGGCGVVAAADCCWFDFDDGRQEREAAAGRTFGAGLGGHVPDALDEERRLFEEEN